MSNAFSIAASGLRTQDFHIHQMANDLANLNTTAYKASQLHFEDAIQKPSPSQDKFHLGLGSAIHSSSKDFSTGPLKASNNWNDLAIDGAGFFQVLQSDGTLAYSRNSSLIIDSERYLATQEGLRLADLIEIPEDVLEIKIEKNGDIEALFMDEEEPQIIGSIKLAKFLNPQALEPLSAGVYASNDNSGEALIDSPGQSGLGSLLQRQVEGSNVDMVSTLMQLTMTERIYQLNAKALQVIDELEKMTNEIHG